MTKHNEVSSENKNNWLYVDLNSYFASVEQELQPHLRSKPVGIVPSLVETTSCIAASYEAKAFGVKTGTRVKDARKMCPGITFIEARHEHYVDFHHKIIDAVEACLPVTAVCSIDEVACALSGSDRLSKNATRLALEIKHSIREKVGRTLKCSIGIGPNRYLAKVASDMEKPDGLTLLEQSELPQKLFSLKARDLPGVGAAMERRLHAAGIFSMEKIFSLTKLEMSSIWNGILGERMYDWIRGVDFDPPQDDLQKSLGHSHVLPPELRTVHGAWSVLQKLTHKVGSRLRRNRLWTRGFGIYLRSLESSTWSEGVKILECQDTLTLLEALRYLWDQAPKQHKIFGVGVHCFNLIPDEEHCLSFFEEKRSKISKAMDGINGKYGSNSLYYGGIHSVRKGAPTRIAFTQIPELEDFE